MIARRLFSNSSVAKSNRFGYVNKVTLIGNVGKDPEIKQLEEGRKMARFSLATSDYVRPKDGSMEQQGTVKTVWHQVVVFQPALADLAEKHIKAGSKVYVEGQLNYRESTSVAGVPKQVTEIVLKSGQGDISILGTSSAGVDEKNDFSQ